MMPDKSAALSAWVEKLTRALSDVFKSIASALRDFFFKPIRYHVVKYKKGPMKGKVRYVLASYSSKTRSYITKVTERKYPNRKALHLG